MSEIIRAIILGVVQGATEFIPVSSSGHLVIVPWLLGWQPESLLFDTVLHWGTLLAILIIFWRDFWLIFLAVLTSLVRRSLADFHARLGWFIVVGSIPAAVTGLLLKDPLEALFASPTAAAGFLLVTGLVLVASELLAKRLVTLSRLEQLRFGDSLIIGLAQALALAPGISRSGTTIAAGLARGLRRDDAARFSFLLGTPAFLGAGLLQLMDSLAVNPAQVQAQLPVLAVGFLASAVTGVLAIRFLLNYLRSRSLYIFAVYCCLLGLLVLALNLA